MTASVEAKAPRDTGYIGLGEALSWVGWRHSIGNIELHNAIAAGELGEDADQALAAALNDLMAHVTASRVELLGKVARSHGDVDAERLPIEPFRLVDFQRYEIVRDALWRGKGLVWFPTPFDLIFDDVPGYSEVLVDRSQLAAIYPWETAPARPLRAELPVHRRKGVSLQDEPHVHRMAELIRDRRCASPHAASLVVVESPDGALKVTTVDAARSRLRKLYGEMYSPDGAPLDRI